MELIRSWEATNVKYSVIDSVGRFCCMFAAFSPLLAVVAVAPKLCKNGSPVNKLDWDRVCSVWAEQPLLPL